MKAIQPLLEDRDPAVRLRGFDLIPRIRVEVHVRLLATLLKDPSVEVRLRAMSRMHGAEFRPSIPQLLLCLKSDAQEERLQAARALAMIGSDSAKTTALFIAALQSPDRKIRRSMAEVLGNTPGPNKDTRDALIALLKDKEEDVRIEAGRALIELGFPEEVQSMAVAMLKDKDVGVRRTAMDLLLVFLGPHCPEGLPIMLKELEAGGDQVQSLSHALVAYGVESLPTFKSILTTTNDERRVEVLRTLNFLRASAAPLTKEVAKLLDDDDIETRELAVFALGSMGTQARAALPGLLRLVKDSDPDVRYAAVFAVEAIGENRDIIPALIASLDDREDIIQGAAAISLAKRGVAAKESLPTLLRIVKRSNGQARIAAALAIAVIDPDNKSGLPILRAVLSGRSERERNQLNHYLEFLGIVPASMIPDVVAMSKHNDYKRNYEAGRAIALLPPEQATVLAECLNDSDRLGRVGAAVALSRASAQQCKGVLPALLKAINDPSPDIALPAAIAVLKVDSAHPKSLRVLRDNILTLSQRLWFTRYDRWPYSRPAPERHWIWAISLLGADARPAILPLERIARDDPDTAVREQAKKTLAVIRKK